jgi:predicted nucleotidyltransferase
MEILSKLFGSEAKVKIIRLFLFAPETIFDVHTIAERVKEDVSKVRREILGLEKILLVKRRAITSKKIKNATHGFILNKDFSYLIALQNFLINTKTLQPKEIIKRFSTVGSIKLIIVSGIFLQNNDSRVDILVVGDNIKKAPFENAIKNLEAEIGKELRYVYFGTQDFIYRLNMYDKLIRDILDYPHQKVVNKLANL